MMDPARRAWVTTVKEMHVEGEFEGEFDIREVGKGCCRANPETDPKRSATPLSHVDPKHSRNRNG